MRFPFSFLFLISQICFTSCASRAAVREGTANFSSPFFPKSLQVEYIVADFQLCFYNPLLLIRTPEECGLTFESRDSGRRIFKGKELIIEKSNSTVRLINHLRGYVYTLEGF